MTTALLLLVVVLSACGGGSAAAEPETLAPTGDGALTGLDIDLHYAEG